MKKTIIAGFLCLAFVSIDCGGGTRASINTIVYLEDTGGQAVDPNFGIDIYKDDGFAYIPMVIVNSETLATEEGLAPGSSEMFTYSCITDWLLPGGDFDMTVDYGEGRGQVKDSLPDFFTIAEPQSSDVLEINENLDISWGTSQCAGWYWVTVYTHYEYLDTDSNYRDYTYDNDTIVYDTQLTISADDLFPEDAIAIVYDYNTYVYVAAYTGPDPKPLARGNVTGDAVGFFWAYYDQAVYFAVGFAALNAESGIPADPSARHRQILLDWASQQ